MMFAHNIDDAHDTVLIDHSHLRLYAFGSPLVNRYIIVYLRYTVIHDTSHCKIIIMKYGIERNRIFSHRRPITIQLFFQIYYLHLQLSVS